MKEVLRDSLSYSTFINTANTIFQEEAEALSYCINNFPPGFENLIEAIVECKGKVIFSGLGKSGLVAQMATAVFSSFGIPSLFLHPTEALHGDLGVFQSHDICIALSKSGEGEELTHILSFLNTKKIFSALISCRKGNLASSSSLFLTFPLKQELSFFPAAPTISTTLMLVVIHVLAIEVSKRRSFSSHNYASFHPGGSLGRSLILTVESLMHTQKDIPFVLEHCDFQTVIYTITQKKLGLCIVTDENHVLKGIITDGDLRRACDEGKEVFEKKAYQIMSLHPKTIESFRKAEEALLIMQKNAITSLVVMEGTIVVGLLHMHDLLKNGIRTLL